MKAQTIIPYLKSVRNSSNIVWKILLFCIRLPVVVRPSPYTYFLMSFIFSKDLFVCRLFSYVPLLALSSRPGRGICFCELSSREFWLAYRCSVQL